MRIDLRQYKLLSNEETFSRLCFAKPARRLGNKTQMFGGSEFNVHLHNRLSHSLEVLSIATKLSAAIKGFADLDISLLNSIAISHDFGHTPFGHIGETTLNKRIKYFMGEKNKRSASFKHNINSVRILLDDEKIYNQSGKGTVKYREFLSHEYDWRLFDGIMNHTSTFKSSFSEEPGKDEYNLDYVLSLHPVFNNEHFRNFIVSISKTYFYKDKFKGVNFLKSFSLNNFVDAYLYLNTPLSLEGMIIRIADELAQRVSDVSDILEYAAKKKDSRVFSLIDDCIQELNNCLPNLLRIKDETKNTDPANILDAYRHRICGSTIDLIKFCFNELQDFKKQDSSTRKRHSQRVIKKIHDFLIVNEYEYINLFIKNKDKNIFSFVIDFSNCSKQYDVYLPTKKKDGTYGPLLDIEGEFIGLVDSKLDEMSEKAYEIIEAIKKNNEKGAEYIRTLFDAYSDNANLSEFSSRDKVANNIMDYLKLKDQAVYKATKCTPSDDLETVIEKIEATIDKDDKVHNKVYSLFFYGIASEISLYTNNICKEKAIKVKKS